MNKEEIIKAVIEKFRTNNIPYGPMYILPNGDILDLSILENGHMDFWDYLDTLIPITSYPQYDITNYLRDLGWIKANTKVEYIESDYMPTEKQLNRICEILKLYPVTAKIQIN